MTDERANETRLGGTNGFSASRGIPRHVCNSMFYYHLDKKTAADPFAVTLRQSATQKNMSVSGSLSVSTTRSYGEFWAPRPNTKSYNITGCLRPWILFAGPPFPPPNICRSFSSSAHLYCGPTRASNGSTHSVSSTIPHVAYVPVFPHMHVAVLFAGNVW